MVLLINKVGGVTDKLEWQMVRKEYRWQERKGCWQLIDNCHAVMLEERLRSEMFEDGEIRVADA